MGGPGLSFAENCGCFRIASGQQSQLVKTHYYLMAITIAAGAATKSLLETWCLGFRAVVCPTRCLSPTLRICPKNAAGIDWTSGRV